MASRILLCTQPKSLFVYVWIKSGLEFNRLIKKCKAIVKLLRFKSAVVSQRQAELKEFYSTFIKGADHTYAVNVSPDDIGNTSLKQMVPTRWNSCLTLLKSILVNKIVINDILEVDGSEFILSSSDMTVILQLVSFLEPFKIQKDIMQGELYPTIALICPAIQTLLFHCRQAIWDSNALTQLKNTVKTEFDHAPSGKTWNFQFFFFIFCLGCYKQSLFSSKQKLIEQLLKQFSNKFKTKKYPLCSNIVCN